MVTDNRNWVLFFQGPTAHELMHKSGLGPRPKNTDFPLLSLLRSCLVADNTMVRQLRDVRFLCISANEMTRTGSNPTPWASKMKPAKSSALFFFGLAGAVASTFFKMRASRSVVDEPNAIRSSARLSNRSQFGCELSLRGVAPDGARKRSFEARDSGPFAARRPDAWGAETARRADTYVLTRG